MVTQLLFGDAFEVVEQKDSWHRIITQWDHYEGWIDRKQYRPLSKHDYDLLAHHPAPVATELFQFLTDQKSGVTFPVSAGSSLPFLENGICRAGDHHFIYEGNAREFTPVTDRNSIIETALMFQHSPYLWGGKTPFGLDCSGFTQMVFKANGIRLKRDAYQQAETGLPYSFVEEAMPGDLAFFDNEEGRIVHVGIVMDDGKIIHASGRVRIDPFDHYGIFTKERGGYTHNLRVIKSVI